MAMNTVDVSSQKASEVPSMVEDPDDTKIPKECATGEADLYNKESKVGAIASHKGFLILGLAMTVLFLIWIGIDADYNAAAVLCEAEPVFQAAHMVFFLFFGTEALVRFSAVRDKCKILKCRALIWDIILVILLFVRMAVTSIESSGIRKILMVVVMVQFTRQFRLFKRAEKADTSSLKVEIAREVLHCFLLIVFIHYMFAIVLSKLTQDTEVGEEYFRNVVQGMQSLRWQHVSEVPGALRAESKFFFVPYIAFRVRCCVVAIRALKNVVVLIRGNQKAQTQCTDNSKENKDEEIPERV